MRHEPPEEFAIIFRTGFEPAEAVGTPQDAHESITYRNTAVPPSSDHVRIPSPATVSISYQGGTARDRYARIVEDPTRPGNHVLHYRLRNATVPAYRSHTKGRIQQNFGFGDHPDGDEVVELYGRQRLRLHPDVALVTDYDLEDDWWLEPMIQELWMEAGRFRSRISIYLAEVRPDKLHPVATLTYRYAWQDYWETAWAAVGDVAIPVGEWVSMEVGWKMGDAESGRFILTVQRAGDAGPVRAIDVTNWTYNPNSSVPISLSRWNPQKLYASDNIAHFVRDNGGALQMYFDDFSFADALPEAWR
jgi:hypothetical protein